VEVGEPTILAMLAAMATPVAAEEGLSPTTTLQARAALGVLRVKDIRAGMQLAVQAVQLFLLKVVVVVLEEPGEMLLTTDAAAEALV
jgi:hypothetical protein